ncbi:MAG: hypothetical protein EZS28_029370 [Streblomastix strix]|uniref:Uncharacterized protein n=1 Tax=Streblomastix strix TaxID=222440 RepID=A0A5J4UY01_9EUKA|nr:MAG: hypothetical protein EZS28_029370 [Streblomastix strix]
MSNCNQHHNDEDDDEEEDQDDDDNVEIQQQQRELLETKFQQREFDEKYKDGSDKQRRQNYNTPDHNHVHNIPSQIVQRQQNPPAIRQGPQRVIESASTSSLNSSLSHGNMPIEESITCPFCMNQFPKLSVQMHVNNCNKIKNPRLILNSIIKILPQMEQNPNGQFKAKEGEKLQCPFCTLTIQNHLEQHILKAHKQESQLFQRLLLYQTQLNQKLAIQLRQGFIGRTSLIQSNSNQNSSSQPPNESKLQQFIPTLQDQLQQGNNIPCPFCQKEFAKSAALKHAQTCSRNTDHRLLFKGARDIVLNMEMNAEGNLREKPGYEPICPICNEQLSVVTLDGHIFGDHPDEDQLFQNLLKFHYELKSQQVKIKKQNIKKK